MILPSGAYDAGTFHAIFGVRARVATILRFQASGPLAKMGNPR